MTTLIVLPAPPAQRTAPTGDVGGDPTADAGRFAALLDAALAAGLAAGAENPTESTSAPAGEPAGEPVADAVTGSDAATPSDVVPSPVVASGVARAGALPPAAPSSPMPEPSATSAAASATGVSPSVTSGADPGGDAPPAPPSSAMPEPSPGAAARARASAGTGDVDAPFAEATTDRGAVPAEAARPDGASGSGFGHAERSGAGGTPRPGAAPEVTPAAHTAPAHQTTPATQNSQAVEASQHAAPTTGVERSTGMTATGTTAEPPAPRPVAAQVVEQLEARWPAVRAGGPGTHVMTIRLEPEHFGPLRLVAHIGAEGVRIELLGATDAARDALRQALPDLRRDLVGVGLTADLDLGGRGQGADRSAAGSGDPDAGRNGGSARGDETRASADRTRPTGPSDPGGPIHPTIRGVHPGRLDLTV